LKKKTTVSVFFFDRVRHSECIRFERAMSEICVDFEATGCFVFERFAKATQVRTYVLNEDVRFLNETNRYNSRKKNREESEIANKNQLANIILILKLK
jgi:hypothetical protein